MFLEMWNFWHRHRLCACDKYQVWLWQVVTRKWYGYLEEKVDGVLELRLAEVEQVSIDHKHHHVVNVLMVKIKIFWLWKPEYNDVENVANDAKESNHWDGDPVHQHHHQLLSKDIEVWGVWGKESLQPNECKDWWQWISPKEVWGKLSLLSSTS